MPTLPNSINLIRTKTSSSPQMDAVDRSLRRSGYVGLVGFVGIAIVVAIFYIILIVQSRSLQQENTQLATRIDAEKNKEGLLLAIKDRTKIVEKAISNQKPWAEVLDLVGSFASAPALSSISVGEQNKITISLRAWSLEEVYALVNAIIEQEKDKRLKNPQLLSIQIENTGGISLSFSFFALFPTQL